MKITENTLVSDALNKYRQIKTSQDVTVVLGNSYETKLIYLNPMFNMCVWTIFTLSCKETIIKTNIFNVLLNISDLIKSWRDFFFLSAR